jgi:hypothetical protein
MENELRDIINAEVEKHVLNAVKLKQDGMDCAKEYLKLEKLDEYSNLYTLYEHSKEYSKSQEDVKLRRRTVNRLP